MDNFFLIINLIELIKANNFIYILFLFTLLSYIYNSLCLPGNMVFIVFSGYLFGTYTGFLVSLLTISLGSFNFYLVSKFIFFRFFPSIYKKYSLKIDTYVKNSTFEYLVIIRMIPGPPLMLQNFLFSLVNVGKLKFLFSTFIGLTPIIFITSFFGSKLKSINDIKNYSINEILTFDFFIFIFIIILLVLVKVYYNKK